MNYKDDDIYSVAADLAGKLLDLELIADEVKPERMRKVGRMMLDEAIATALMTDREVENERA
jgi:hypothetical protein